MPASREQTQPIYLDYNATTPHSPEVVEAMRPFLEEHFGNPSSAHWYGRVPREAVAIARAHVAALLNCSPAAIWFTSGGTESNNTAIEGVMRAQRSRGRHIITTEIEHPAVTAVCARLQQDGCEVTYLPVDGQCRVRAEDVDRAIRPETVLITVMHANNETGVVQPVEEIARIARRRNVVFHTDAAQSAGKLPLDVTQSGADLVSLAGHKLYAPKGVGALYVRPGTPIESWMLGAGQEAGHRAGTENVVQIVGLGKACEIARRDLAKNMAHLQATRDRLEQGLCTRIQRVRVNGSEEGCVRLPNTASVSFEGVEADALLREIGDSVAASAGAACHSGEARISHVLRAMRLPDNWAKGTVRFSTGRTTTAAEVDDVVRAVAEAVARLRH
ncbi:MAG: aminotransferase class V-fold PLP-dependent enzyme [Bryobacterales bacterium]|nr:aminotransferase class V-fold PLP-dependent enzyme [Bryobacterales bacterium]